MMEIPTLSANLIREIAENEPELSIHFGMTMAEVQYKAGRWSVINELLQRLNHYDNIKPNETEIIL